MLGMAGYVRVLKDLPGAGATVSLQIRPDASLARRWDGAVLATVRKNGRDRAPRCNAVPNSIPLHRLCLDCRGVVLFTGHVATGQPDTPTITAAMSVAPWPGWNLSNPKDPTAPPACRDERRLPTRHAGTCAPANAGQTGHVMIVLLGVVAVAVVVAVLCAGVYYYLDASSMD
jgi:hypothetical protein